MYVIENTNFRDIIDIENLDYNSLFQIERGGKKEMIRRKGISYRGISFESKISKISVMIIFQSEGQGEGEGDKCEKRWNIGSDVIGLLRVS